MTQGRRGCLKPWTVLRVAVSGAEVGIHPHGLLTGNRVRDWCCPVENLWRDQPPIATRPQCEGVETPSVLRPADAREQRDLIAAHATPVWRRRSVLLRRDLRPLPTGPSLA